jgi:hypothetical protein
MGYASASRGFKSGGFNVRAQSSFFPASAEPFDDEVLDVLEVGLKTILADRQLVLNTAAFYGEYTDIQVSTFTAFDSERRRRRRRLLRQLPQRRRRHHAGARGRIRLEAAGRPLARPQGYVSWLDAEPDDFLDANNDGFVDTQVITNAPEVTSAPAGEGRRPGLRRPAHRDGRRQLPRRLGADQRGRPRSAQPGDRAAAARPGGLHHVRRVAQLAVAGRALGDQGQRLQPRPTRSSSPTATTSRCSASSPAPTARRRR